MVMPAIGASPARIDVGQDDLFGTLERLAELVEQLRRPRIAVRLKHRDDAPVDARPRGRQHGGDLGRVMAIVVHHQDAAGLAARLKAALGPLELAKRPGDVSERDVELESDGDRAQAR